MKNINIIGMLFLFGLSLIFQNCVYDPPPKIRVLDVKNASSDSLILFFVKANHINLFDSSVIENSINIPPNTKQKIPLIVLPPQSNGQIGIGGSKNWLDQSECKCVKFYFIKFSTYKNYSWANILSDSLENYRVITWNINDVLNKQKTLVYDDK